MPGGPAASAYRRLEFHKVAGLLAMRVGNEDCSPVRSTAEIQPQLQPALLRLLAMIYAAGSSENELRPGIEK
jgi:hypothetical protein